MFTYTNQYRYVTSLFANFQSPRNNKCRRFSLAHPARGKWCECSAGLSRMTWRAGSLFQAGRDGRCGGIHQPLPFCFVSLFRVPKKPAYSYSLHQNSLLTSFATPFLHLFQHFSTKTHEALTPKSLTHRTPTREEVFWRFSRCHLLVARQHWKQILGRLCWGLQGGQGAVNDKMLEPKQIAKRATLFADEIFHPYWRLEVFFG